MSSIEPPNERPVDRQTVFGRLDWLIASLLALAALIVYIRTLAPDVLLGDGGEFQVLGATLGLAHTTGYPLYILLAKLATLLPIGTIAYRVDLLSAIMGAVTAVELFLLARALDVRRIYSVLGALALLVSPLFWWQSVIAKPHVVTAPFFLCLLLCILVWKVRRKPWLLAVAGLFGGLCLGLHHIVVLTLPAVLLYLILSKASKADWKFAIVGVVLGSAISFVAYIAMASVENVTTAINSIAPSASAFGLQRSDLDSPLARVGFVFFSKQYGNQLLSLDPAQLSKNVARLGFEVYHDFGLFPVIIAFAGAIGLLDKRSRKEAVLILGSLLLMLAFAVKFTIFDLEEHFVQPYLLTALCIAFGLQTIQNAVLKRSADRLPVRLASAVIAAIALLLGNLPVWSGGLLALQESAPTFLAHDARRIPFPVDTPGVPHLIGQAVISAVPDGALILTTWDWEWPCYYVAQFEANKPNVSVVELLPQGTFTPGVTTTLTPSMQQFIDESLAKRPVYETQRHQLLAAYAQVPIIPADSHGNGVFRLMPRKP